MSEWERWMAVFSAHGWDDVDFINDCANQFILNFQTPRVDESECPICFEAMDLAKIVVTPCCGHSFHGRCMHLSGWRCPLCRGILF